MAATRKTSRKGGKGAAKKSAKKSSAKKSAAKKSAAKKSAAGKPAAKKSAAKKASAGRSGAKKAGYKVQPGKCSGWRAIHDFQPVGPPTLRVTGKCVFPTSGYKVRLEAATPQGFNPSILLLNKIVTPPTGPVLQVLTAVAVEFTLETNFRYTNVTILPDGVTIKVQQVF